MNALKQLLHELHRRSLWQVLGIFLAASWGVLQVVQAVTESAGLPDWTPGMAFVLLLVGLPVVLATAFIQRGMPGGKPETGWGSDHLTDGGFGTDAPDLTASSPGEVVGNLAPGTGSLDRPSTRPTRTRRLFTWRNALLGGVGASATLGFSLVAYFVMWEAGIGPVGNLEARGVFEEGEAIVLADFQNRSADATLGAVVTEALRVDLASSRAITLVSGARVSEILGLMQRDESEGLPADVAREVAIRGGIKAVVDGEVGSAGSGYILTAAIRDVETGEPLATFRRTAASPDEVIAAIDGLSQDIRERAGESLRSIKGQGSLEQFTTASLEALRLYSEADRVSERGDAERAKELLVAALSFDPDFAMAWRKLAVVLQTAAAEPGEAEAAATRAYELSERLTPLERGQAVAYYHNTVSGDTEAGIRAYEEILRDYPDDPTALNNIAILFSRTARFEEAIERLDQAVSGPGTTLTAYVNLVFYYVRLGRVDEARRAQAELAARAPRRDEWILASEFEVAALAGDLAEAMEIASTLETLPGASTLWRLVGAEMRLVVDALRGEWGPGRRRMADLIARQRGAESPLHEVTLRRRLAEFEHVVRGDDQAALSIVRTLLDDGVLEAIPVQARPYQALVVVLIRVGAGDLAARLMEEWSEVSSSASRPVIDDLAVVVEAMSSPDPEAHIRGIDQYRARTLCSRCFGWEYAGLLYDAGRLEAAAAAYETAMSVSSTATGGFNFFPVMRVVGHERLGGIYEELGDRARAAEHYAVFADAFPDGDAEAEARKDRAHRRSLAPR